MVLVLRFVFLPNRHHVAGWIQGVRVFLIGQGMLEEFAQPFDSIFAKDRVQVILFRMTVRIPGMSALR